MKILFRTMVLLTAVLTASGCASSYWANRGRDAADIFTATVGVGVGAKVRVGPLQPGLLAQTDGAGLRGGVLSDVSGTRTNQYMPPCTDLVCVFVGIEGFDTGKPVPKVRHKHFIAQPLLPLFYRVHRDSRSPSYYTQIEAAVALWPSLRVGFNPGELLDFLFGWFGLDIFQDDVGTQTEEKHPNPPSTRTP